MSLVKNYEYIRDWANNKFLTKDDKIEVDLSNLVEKDEINALIASGTQDLSSQIDYVSNRVEEVAKIRAYNTYRGYSTTDAYTAEKYVDLLGTSDTYLAIQAILYITFTYTNAVSPSSLKLKVESMGAYPIKTIINGQLVDLPSADILKAGMIYAFAYVYINSSYCFVLMNCDTSAQPGTLNTTSTSALSTNSSESLGGSISLHKIAKTGSYNDLVSKPTIPTTTSSVTSGSSEALTSGGAYTALSAKENTSNKVTSISSSSTDTQYPSAKAVYTQIGNVEAVLDQIIQPTPVLSVTDSVSISATVGYPDSEDIRIAGDYLTGNVSLSLSGTNAAMFSLSTTSVTKSQALAGYYVTLTYTPTDSGMHSATITVSSSGATSKTIAITGTAILAS